MILRYYRTFSLAVLFLLAHVSLAQKSVSLEDVWQNYTFRQRSIQNLNWTKDGQHYTELKEGKIIKYSVVDPKNSEVLFDEEIHRVGGKKINVQSFSLSSDELKILISTESEQIYRRSSKENNFIFDRQNKSIVPLSKSGKQMHASFSPMEKK